MDKASTLNPSIDIDIGIGDRRRQDALAAPPQDAQGMAQVRNEPASGIDLAQRRDSLFRRSLGVADMWAVSLALVSSAALLGDDRLTLGAIAVPVLFVAVAKITGLYDRDEHLLHRTTLDEAPALFGLATTSTLLLWFANGLVVDGVFSRAQILGTWLLLFALLVVFRSIARNIARRWAPVERCLFVGDSSSASEFGEKLASSHAVRAELVGWLPTRRSTDSEVDLQSRIARLIEEHAVQRVVLGPTAAHSEGLLDAIRRIKAVGVKVSVLPDVARVVDSSIELDRLNGITLLGVRRFEITKSSRIIKRGFDLAGSLVGLTLLGPVMLFVTIAIRLDSRGPVLFRQQRAGRHGKPFEMLKFRSMVEGAEDRHEQLLALNETDGVVFKIADDPRITRVGRIIRRIHLDELPQLFNVLRGDMSLVGPRPLPLAEDQMIEGWHRRRLDLRPGITGPWQVLGSSRIPVREMVKLDYKYVGDWSVWNDVRILLLTVPHVFRRRGL